MIWLCSLINLIIHTTRIGEGEGQKFILVRPLCLTFHESLSFHERWRWICNFRNEVSCRRFGNAIHKDADQGNLHEYEEAHAETKQDTFAI